RSVGFEAHQIAGVNDGGARHYRRRRVRGGRDPVISLGKYAAVLQRPLGSNVIGVNDVGARIGVIEQLAVGAEAQTVGAQDALVHLGDCAVGVDAEQITGSRLLGALGSLAPDV